MTNFKYYKISKTKKIRYLCNYYEKNVYIVFLHGFMSDLEGEKPKVFLKYAKKFSKDNKEFINFVVEKILLKAFTSNANLFSFIFSI